MRFSVVMPTYNRERYIGEAIESIINQTTSDWELIIVDDASTDNTEYIISEYKDKRIKYVKLKAKKGVAYARNIGYELSSGEYIAIADSDDLNHPDRLSKMGLFLERHKEVDVVVSDVQLIDEHGTKGSILEFRKNNTELRAWWLFQPKLPSFMMFRKERIQSRNKLYHDEGYMAAVDYQWYSNLDKDVIIATLPEVLYFYRRHQNQISTDGYKTQQYYADKIRKKLLKTLVGVEPTIEEMELHSRFSQGKFESPSISTFSNYLIWTETIFNSNHKKGKLDSKILSLVLLEQLIQIIESQGMFQERFFNDLQSSFLSASLTSYGPQFNKTIIQKRIPLNKRLYIYGSKMMGFCVGKETIDMGYDVRNFLDGNQANWSKQLLGKTIINPEHAIDLKQSYVIISVLSDNKYDISNMLITRYGVNADNIVYSSDITM